MPGYVAWKFAHRVPVVTHMRAGDLAQIEVAMQPDEAVDIKLAVIDGFSSRPLKGYPNLVHLRKGFGAFDHAIWPLLDKERRPWSGFDVLGAP